MTSAAAPAQRFDTTREILVSIALLIAAMVSVQTGASLAKQMFAAVGAQGATALRLSFSCLILLVLFRPWRGALSGRQARAAIAYGVSMGVMNLCFYMALRTLPLGLTVTIEFAGPLALAVIASHRKLDLVWVGLALAGIVLLLWLGQSTGNIDPVGVAFAAGAGGFWALYIWFGQRVGAVLRSDRAAALGAVAAAVVVIPVGAVHAGARLLNPAIWPVAVAVAILSSALPYSLEMVAMKRLPTRTFGVLMSLDPAFAALSGLIILGERLTLSQWAGLACVMAASLGAAATARSQAPTIELTAE
jgi:inner membrane transporter RhtA